MLLLCNVLWWFWEIDLMSVPWRYDMCKWFQVKTHTSNIQSHWTCTNRKKMKWICSEECACERARAWARSGERRRKMFNDFLIWLPYSLIFHSFVPLYGKFRRCNKDSVRVSASASACVLYLTDLFNFFFLFIPRRFGDIIRRSSIEISLPPVTESSKKNYTNKAEVKRREVRENGSRRFENRRERERE